MGKLGELLYKMFAKDFGSNQKCENSNHATRQTTDKISESTIVKHHRVAGVSHYTDNLLTLATENPDYVLKKNELIKRKMFNETIYQYDFYPGKVDVIPEPTNQYDPNAVQVLIDEKLVGYIKAGSCKHILNLINENRIEKIESKIEGGKYKCLISNDISGEDCEVERGTDEFRIKLTIYERNKEK